MSCGWKKFTYVNILRCSSWEKYFILCMKRVHKLSIYKKEAYTAYKSIIDRMEKNLFVNYLSAKNSFVRNKFLNAAFFQFNVNIKDLLSLGFSLKFN